MVAQLHAQLKAFAQCRFFFYVTLSATKVL